jgi:hypothetical protein
LNKHRPPTEREEAILRDVFGQRKFKMIFAVDWREREKKVEA